MPLIAGSGINLKKIYIEKYRDKKAALLNPNVTDIKIDFELNCEKHETKKEDIPDASKR